MAQIEKIKAEIERLKKSLPWGSCASQLSMECNCKNEAYNEVLPYIDSLEEEPVSNDLEEAARKAGQKYFPNEDNIWARPNYEAKKAECAFMEGAQLQKEQTINKTCEWLKENLPRYWGQINANNTEGFIEDFKKAMEE